MKRYRVDLNDWVLMTAAVIVEAESKEEAKQKAIQMGEEGHEEVHWEHSYESQGRCTVDEVELLEDV